MNVLKKYGIKKEEWNYHGEWQQPVLSGHFWLYYYDDEERKKMTIPPQTGRVMMFNGHFLTRKEDIERLAKALKEALIKKDDSLYNNYVNTANKALEGFLEFSKQLRADGGIELFKKFIDESRKVFMTWWMSGLFSDYFGDFLVEEAEKLGIPSDQVMKYVPKKETLILKQHREVIEIKKMLEKENLLGKSEKEIKKHPEIWNKIEKHVKEFEWIGFHHLWGETLTIKKLLEEILITKETKEEEIEEPPEELKFMVKIAGDIAFLRTYSPEVFNIVGFKALPLLKNLAKELGLTYKEFLMLTVSEVINHFEKGTKPDKKIISLRRKHFCLFKYKGEEVILSDKKSFDELVKAFVPQADTTVNEVRGMIANKGYAKGTVKVFLVPENMDKMKQGDILVTTMTTPDFVPLMKKAGAIVTDIGGLLSHASIISRELGKPCIIATGFSTKILKDGDKVEVDANEGVVRKLK